MQEHETNPGTPVNTSLVHTTFGFQYGPAMVRRMGFGDSWATIEVAARDSHHRVTVKVTADGEVQILNQR